MRTCGDSLIRNGVDLTLPDTDIPICYGSENDVVLGLVCFKRRLQEFDAVYEHERSEKMFGLKTAMNMTDEMFREQQL